MPIGSFREHLIESTLLLEYDAKKTWDNHGKKAHAQAISAYEEEGDRHPTLNTIYLNHTSSMNQTHDSVAGDILRSHLENTDPTPNKKYVQHIARIYGSGGVNRFEDLHSRMKPALKQFDDLAKRKIIPAEHRDIGRIKSLGQLEDLVDEHSGKKSSREEDAAYHEEMKKQATITEHPDFTHIIPHTERAASHFGKGTKWCTARDNPEDSMFDHYNDRGPLHIYIPKKPKYKGEKYQYHYSDSQRMDEKDETVPNIVLKKRQPAIHEHMEDYAADVDMAKAKANIKDFDHPEASVRANVLHRSPDIEDKHLLKAISDVPAYTDTASGAHENSPWTHPRIQPHHLDHLLDKTNHSKKDLESINDALFFKGNPVHDPLTDPFEAPYDAKNNLIQPHHIDKMIDISNKMDWSHLPMMALKADAANEHHVTKALASDNKHVVAAATYSPAFRNDMHFDTLYNHKHVGEAVENYISRQHNNRTKDKIEPGYGFHTMMEKLATHPNEEVKYKLAKHFAISQKYRDRIFSEHPHLKDKYEQEQKNRRNAWNGVNEGRVMSFKEHLTELSKPLLKSYIAKMRPNVMNARKAVPELMDKAAAQRAAKDDSGANETVSQAKKIDRRHRNHMKGYDRAIKRIREETEQLEELSQVALRAYARKGRESVEKIENSTDAKDPEFSKKDNKAFKRRMYVTFAQHRLKEEQLDELSNDTLTSYAIKANSDIKNTVKKKNEAIKNHNTKMDGNQRHKNKPILVAKIRTATRKADNRRAGVKSAMSKINPTNSKFSVHEETELSNVVDNSGSEVINERTFIDPVKYVSVKDRATKGSDVRQKHTQRERHMYSTLRTKDVVNYGFRKAGEKSQELRDKEGHDLTNRWNDERKRRISNIRKNINFHESAEYIEARKQLHMAHHESARRLAGMERDPELRRIDLHRAKKHLHAANVLDILKTKGKLGGEKR